MNIAALIPAIIAEITKRIPDPVERARVQMELEGKMAEGQMETNKTEAAHRSIFVAGWRPFIGWVGGSGLAYQFLVRPIAEGFGFPMPEVDTNDLLTLVAAMLGFGGFRMFEKIKGVASK